MYKTAIMPKDKYFPLCFLSASRLTRRATPDEIRRQPEYQYLTSWAYLHGTNNACGLMRPHTAATESAVHRTCRRPFSSESLAYSEVESYGTSRLEKGILRQSQGKHLSGIFEHGRHRRHSSLGPRSHGMEVEFEGSIYKNIAHLFHADLCCLEGVLKPCPHDNDGWTGGKNLLPKKKVIRFVDACKGNVHEICSEPPVKALDELEKAQDVQENNIDNEIKNDINERDPNNPDTAKFMAASQDKSCTKLKPENEMCSDKVSTKTDNPVQHEDFKSDTDCSGKEIEHVKLKLKSALSNTSSDIKICFSVTDEHSDDSSKQSRDQIDLSKKDVNIAKNNNDCVPGGNTCKNKTVVHSRKQPSATERSNSNYDADLEKCDKYLRSQSRTFTQTSQYMNNTKRGLSKLSVHYSQTNTAHNDRVIMSDLLRNGHTRNAVIGDSVYAIERRLYSKRRDPQKSTTFYYQFASQTLHSASQNRKSPSAPKRKSRTVADRAKERQERINKKKEELERGFPPRAWSLVEIGVKDIEHMLNTCRYLRVDIRKQPNVYGNFDEKDTF